MGQHDDYYRAPRDDNYLSGHSGGYGYRGRGYRKKGRYENGWERDHKSDRGFRGPRDRDDRRNLRDPRDPRERDYRERDYKERDYKERDYRERDYRDSRDRDPRDRDYRDSRDRDPRDRDFRDSRDRDPRERDPRDRDPRSKDPRDRDPRSKDPREWDPRSNELKEDQREEFSRGSRSSEDFSRSEFSRHRNSYRGGRGGHPTNDRRSSYKTEPKVTKAKEYENPWIDTLSIQDTKTKDILELRFKELEAVNKEITALQMNRRKLVSASETLERQVAREELHVQISAEKLEEFTYI